MGTATRELAGWLASVLSPYLGSFSPAHLRNSIDFKSRLVEFASFYSLSNVKILSLDVKSLFTNVPLDSVLDFIDRKIEGGFILTPIPKPQFLRLVELCVNNNCFEFGGNYYRQSFGISMGSPLSPVLAGLYMEYFESELLPTLPMAPPLWLRYVDDVFVIWREDCDFDLFFSGLNNLARTISFSVEWEENGSLPFLDTRVFRLQSGFQFAIYRKPMHAGQYMHFFSWHPKKVKRSVLFSLFLRAHRLCDAVYLDEEIQHIFETFNKLAYPRRFIEKILSDVRRKFFNNSSSDRTNTERKPTISLPYNDFCMNYVKPVFTSNNVRVVNSASNTIRKRLTRTRPCLPITDDAGPGVYMIKCGECEQCYVGETGRCLTTRLREHRDAVRLGRGRNAVYNHVFETNHAINWSESKLLYNSHNLNSRLIVESALIKSSNNFNNTQGVCSIDNLSTSLILSSLPKIPDTFARWPPPTLR